MARARLASTPTRDEAGEASAAQSLSARAPCDGAARNEPPPSLWEGWHRVSAKHLPAYLDASNGHSLQRDDELDGVNMLALKPAPDAMQLACASSANVDLFVTNDERVLVRA